ncbi:hypothetical protein I307_06568 [Cryptococcus deuterogattii 99/473]|uniref:G-patch domain-containing protein n=1 Tax=Cryptococcus deuterogattii Ram5 TaxID=1296110 RepID=A0A0D0V0U0_9TREE|nr:hypothetical protein I309_03719 [Cryptococcus deuterogattii LA55]KIR38540.1 hypothetical protein I313_05652 [Cryptococcus deuterogattii Ram5]KIR90267.1 hypothetical protein I304_05843 [Cryptococcus deuterogattii CBS 10090]KIR96955.1 hypothetical protein L804_05613 [Cryptococcus deuterogattii 2001/935-1]KIY54113.1 hypothetical protein I307_06568 [Cryptococcus deuterogattii 99/473]
MAVTKTSFDAAKHLEKQGWKGKGTALKNGHATRPLAVVQKKTLSGIGKDRDESVPFWDHIFAATAANLFTPSASSSPAPASSSKWATLTPATVSGISQSGSSSSSPAPPKQRLSISAQTRVSREMARRQLYSRFLRGKVFIPDDEVEIQESEEEWSKSQATEVKAVVERGIDGSSNADKAERKGKKSKGNGKEETNARRAEKKAEEAKEGTKNKKKDKGKQKEERGEEMKEKKGKKEKEKKEKQKGSKGQKADEEKERKRKDKSVDERVDGVEKTNNKKRKCLESDDKTHKRKTSKGQTV